MVLYRVLEGLIRTLYRSVRFSCRDLNDEMRALGQDILISGLSINTLRVYRAYVCMAMHKGKYRKILSLNPKP